MPVIQTPKPIDKPIKIRPDSFTQRLSKAYLMNHTLASRMENSPNFPKKFPPKKSSHSGLLFLGSVSKVDEGLTNAVEAASFGSRSV